MDPDLDLLEHWRAGDRNSGEQLFKRHFADIYRLFKHKAGEEADDLAQRTFLACVTARNQFRSQSTFRTYLFTIARNELYGYLRGRSRTEHVDFEVSSIAELAPSPSTGLRHAEQIERLRAALEQLPAEQQLLLELHYWHDLDAAALGEVFDTAAGTIRVRLVRARQALRERMAESDLQAAARMPGDRLAASLTNGDTHDVEVGGARQ